jgi:hypothetical protein
MNCLLEKRKQRILWWNKFIYVILFLNPKELLGTLKKVAFFKELNENEYQYQRKG